MFKPDREAYYKIDELSDLATPSTIRIWIKDGKLNAVKVGKNYRIKGAEIERFLSQGNKKQK